MFLDFQNGVNRLRIKEIGTVYFSGLIQGLTLVAFPAASIIFTNADQFNFSNAQYGALFIPQVILSVAASLLTIRLNRSGNIKPVMLTGLAANCLSMLLLALSSLFMHHPAAYGILLCAVGFLGIGFGLTVPSLNTLATLFFPRKKDLAVLILNALLGLGTALAPVFVALSSGVGAWWSFPLILAFVIAALLLLSLALNFSGESQGSYPNQKGGIPIRFALFALFALLYGFCETVNGNWSTLYMHKVIFADTEKTSLGLTCFWAMVTIGRLLFASIDRIFPQRNSFRILPFIIAGAFLLTSFFTEGSVSGGIFSFGLAGLGCSAMLPLMISFSTEQLTSISRSVAGGVIAFYLLGYGFAAFGVGVLQDELGMSLESIFRLSAIVAIALGILSFMTVQKMVWAA